MFHLENFQVIYAMFHLENFQVNTLNVNLDFRVLSFSGMCESEDKTSSRACCAYINENL